MSTSWFARSALVAAGSLVVTSSVHAAAVIPFTDLYTLGKPTGFTAVSAGLANGGQVAGGGSGPGTGGENHSVYWTAANRNGVDLDVNSPFGGTTLSGMSATQQIGRGNIGGGNTHALVWSGTAASRVDLNPAGFVSTSGYGVGGNQQVGNGYGAPTGDDLHALLWTGAANNYVDLNPSGFGYTNAVATDGTRQVGNGNGGPTGGNTHALLWGGTAASYVDLNPAGFLLSYGRGVGGGQQVGEGYAGATHALLWNGTAASAVDLNPSGFNYSTAFGTNGSVQIGMGSGQTTNYQQHALLWFGNDASYVDLTAQLPSNFTSAMASSVVGNTVYGYAYDTSGNYHAVTWSVPEPASLGVLALGGLALLRRRTPRTGA